MKHRLRLQHQFIASHSLGGYETPHPHLWKLEVTFRGEPKNGMLVDMVFARSQIEKILKPLEGTYLNESLFVSESVRKAPTCETLSSYFQEKLEGVCEMYFSERNFTIRLETVSVGICDPEGREELGRVELG